jgi:hypothetical protein
MPLTLFTLRQTALRMKRFRLKWQGGIIPRLAQGAYKERQLPPGTLENVRRAVLADALEESGCTGTILLGHLRSGGKHVRGCFVVDALLGKK